MVVAYTDGSSVNGMGGWASLIVYGGSSTTLTGHEPGTHQRMELLAITRTLEYFTRPVSLTIYTDNKPIYEAMNNNTYKRWILNNWQRASSVPVAHSDLWSIILMKSLAHDVKFEYVKGHGLNVYNKKVDKLAYEQALLGLSTPSPTPIGTPQTTI